MSYTITNQCITCHRCQVACPTDAIQIQNGTLLIDANLCNECSGHYGTPQCAAACPTNVGCSSLSEKIGQPRDYWDTWFNHYNTLLTKLKREEPTYCWETWFDVYSREIASLMTTHS
jgi:ferredoxin